MALRSDIGSIFDGFETFSMICLVIPGGLVLFFSGLYRLTCCVFRAALERLFGLLCDFRGPSLYRLKWKAFGAQGLPGRSSE